MWVQAEELAFIAVLVTAILLIFVAKVDPAAVTAVVDLAVALQTVRAARAGGPDGTEIRS
ncbi:hypothetical protein EV385_4210 [Krasilnikovia cinnamomea]|uniref:Uncharacterized protein n=1 Tax=Krasilnikovia cinnamomea TaxID=349313 RepID=A0A4Q7ZMV8_9ACTN|nr:hypothetical protein [Krasilnikovia cinnamomea]RZU52352.1 hypothetical protein EV385_4210 [Krasilnikovia cinnamomea]